MLFNSIEFILFFPLVFLVYWYLLGNNIKLKNAFLLLASYIFYGWWDYRFLALIATSSLVDYLCALGMERVQREWGDSKQGYKRKKIYLLTSLTVNLGMLGVFKYYNFFIDSSVQLINQIGFQANVTSLAIILPVGISFYTFQTLSYTFDVYSGKIKPTKDAITFFAYVSFFPQLVAGPIERATHLLPQFKSLRVLTYPKIVIGLRLLLWGFFKKMVIADNCAPYVDWVFANYQEVGSVHLFWGLVMFVFQVYGDFSGYSDIAIGLACLLGFHLKPNFRYPFFSRNLAEFWTKWHISLYTWFRDYVYVPMGGSYKSTLHTVRNIFIVFMLSALWHGANTSFLFWGFLNFLIIALYFFLRTHGIISVQEERKEILITDLAKMAFTFLLISLTFIYVRSPTIGFGNSYFVSMLSGWDRSMAYTTNQLYLTCLLIILMLIVEWKGREYINPLDKILEASPSPLRWCYYYCIIGLILIIGGRPVDFYYFQF